MPFLLWEKSTWAKNNTKQVVWYPTYFNNNNKFTLLAGMISRANQSNYNQQQTDIFFPSLKNLQVHVCIYAIENKCCCLTSYSPQTYCEYTLKTIILFLQATAVQEKNWTRCILSLLLCIPARSASEQWSRKTEKHFIWWQSWKQNKKINMTALIY